MEKKNYSKLSANLIKFETSTMICGSGDVNINGNLGNGAGVGGSTAGAQPGTSTDNQGNTGIFSEARSNGGIIWD